MAMAQAAYGRIDRQPLDVGIIRDRLEYPVDHTLLDPAIIAPLRRLIGTKSLGECWAK